MGKQTAKVRRNTIVINGTTHIRHTQSSHSYWCWKEAAAVTSWFTAHITKTCVSYKRA